MILEQAVLNILPGRAHQFELAFKQAQQIISGMPGYAGMNFNGVWKIRISI